ncbi:hypothetical protein [Microbispora sp. NPDC049125]|uniref:hypothetical protein n=1 Tax=Microbispora sp. NPDC049125 TaxID=3154929 RepID=UPI00346521BB
MRPHIFSGVVLVVAKNKAQVKEFLLERGLDDWSAGNMAGGLRVTPADAVAVAMLTELGLVNADTPSVHIWKDTTDGNPIVRVDAGGALTTVARWCFEGSFGTGRGHYIDPVTQESQS